MHKHRTPAETIERLEAEMRAVRLELEGAELAFLMLGRAFASVTPEIAGALTQAVSALDHPSCDTPAVRALMDGLQNTRQRSKIARTSQRLRLVIDNVQDRSA